VDSTASSTLILTYIFNGSPKSFINDLTASDPFPDAGGPYFIINFGFRGVGKLLILFALEVKILNREFSVTRVN
jgi:hypothetical protein